MVNILNRREIPHRLDSPHVAPTYGQTSYDVLTTVAQRINPMYGQTSLRRTDSSRTTKTNLLPSYAMLAS